MNQSFSTLANDTVNVFRKSYNLGSWLSKFSRFSPDGYDFKKLSRLEINIIKSNMKPVQHMVNQDTGGIKDSKGDITSLNSDIKIQIRRSNALLKDKLARLKAFEKILSHEQLKVLGKASNSQLICYRILTDNKRVFMESFRNGDLVMGTVATKLVDNDSKQERASQLLIQIIYYLLTLRLMLSTAVLKLIDTSITMLTNKGDFTNMIDFVTISKLLNYEDIMYSNKQLTGFISKHTMKEGRSFAQFLNYSIDTKYYKAIVAILKRHSEIANLDYDEKTDKLLNFIASRTKAKTPGSNVDRRDLRKLLESEEYKTFDYKKFETQDYTEEELQMFVKEGLSDVLGVGAAIGGGLGALVTGLSNPVGWLLLGIFGVFSIKYAIHFYFHMEDWITSTLDDLDSLDALLKARRNDKHTKASVKSLINKINNNSKSKLKAIESIGKEGKISNSDIKRIEQAEVTADGGTAYDNGDYSNMGAQISI